MSTFGKIYKVTTFGESHGVGVGCIIEGVPPLLKIKNSDIQYQLDRRKPNQNSLLSTRKEPDTIEIYSGVEDGVTLGIPIFMMVKNIDMKPGDYKSFSNVPRPGHADFTYLSKYGVKSSSGGGRSSARETVARVAAGALAEKYLYDKYKVEIVSWVNSVGDIEIPSNDNKKFILDLNLTKIQVDLLGTFFVYKNSDNKINDFLITNNSGKYFYISIDDDIYEEVAISEICEKIETENNSDLINISSNKILNFKEKSFNISETINVRCPHTQTAAAIIFKIMKIKLENDSIGGTVSCVIRNCPRSLGEPCFDKFEADLAKAMLSIPATKGFEIGSGFSGTKMK